MNPWTTPSDGRFRLQPGKVIGGEIVIDGELGAGGFGITYRGHDRVLGRAVALKEYFPLDIGQRDGTMSVHAVRRCGVAVRMLGNDRPQNLMPGQGSGEQATSIVIVRTSFAWQTCWGVLNEMIMNAPPLRPAAATAASIVADYR